MSALTENTQENKTMNHLADLAAAGDAEHYGGKAAGLAALLADGENVPSGFVVPHTRVQTLVAEDLAEPLAGLGANPLAVRSSGVDEDGRTTSLAGAHESVLNVAPSASAVLDAVRRVHASGEAVSVVVQPMVDALSAGVAFSVNPVTGDDEVVVSAVAGLADDLVAGVVEGDTWVVAESGTSGEGASLRPEQLAAVAGAARRLAKRRGYPVDIEWAFDATGTLVLLQCRPVTAVPLRPEFEVPPGTWEKDVAHSPGPLSPLFLSLNLMDEAMFERWAARFGFVVKGIRLEHFGGEEYSQIVPLIGKPESTGPNPPWWLLGALARIVPPIRRRMKTARDVLDSGLLDELPRRWEAEWRPEFVQATQELRTTDLRALDDDQLLAHASKACALVTRGMDIHFDLFVPYLVKVHGFIRTAEELLGWASGDALELLAGHSPASSEATQSLAGLAERVRSDPRAHAAVMEHDDPVTALTEIDPPLAVDVATWIEVEGFRVTDYDVAATTVGEIPGLTTQLLRGALRDDGSPTSKPGEVARERFERAVAQLSPTDRTRCHRAFDAASSVFGIREDNVRLIGLVPLGGLRLALLEMGRRLVERGHLDAIDLTMMLTYDELTAALVGQPAEDLEARARRRSAEIAWVRAHPGPLHHGPEPMSPPDMRGLPRAGRIINEALMWAMAAELSPPPANAGEGVAGTGCGGGSHTGPVRVIRDAAEFGKLQPGDVLVCPIANPAWAAVFGLVGAVVCDGGGPLSHTAIVAREHGLPTVMGTGRATSTLVDGQVVTVDGHSGQVTWSS